MSMGTPVSIPAPTMNPTASYDQSYGMETAAVPDTGGVPLIFNGIGNTLFVRVRTNDSFVHVYRNGSGVAAYWQIQIKVAKFITADVVNNVEGSPQFGAVAQCDIAFGRSINGYCYGFAFRCSDGAYWGYVSA